MRGLTAGGLASALAASNRASLVSRHGSQGSSQRCPSPARSARFGHSLYLRARTCCQVGAAGRAGSVLLLEHPWTTPSHTPGGGSEQQVVMGGPGSPDPSSRAASSRKSSRPGSAGSTVGLGRAENLAGRFHPHQRADLGVGTLRREPAYSGLAAVDQTNFPIPDRACSWRPPRPSVSSTIESDEGEARGLITITGSPGLYPLPHRCRR